MENLLLIIVIALIVILIVLLGVVAFFFYNYLKLNQKAAEEQAKNSLNYEDRIPEDIKNQIEDARKRSVQDSVSGHACVDHPESPAKGVCSISGEHYCELCITREKDVRLARKFLHLFLDNTWENTFFLEDELIGEDKLSLLMQIKSDLWKNDGTPVITQKQFKINVETDEIETFTVVMTRPQDSDLVKNKLNFLTH